MSANETFFNRTTCERCGEPLKVRITSWFTEETIGQACMSEEHQIKAMLVAQGKDTLAYEGIGATTFNALREELKAWKANLPKPA